MPGGGFFFLRFIYLSCQLELTHFFNIYNIIYSFMSWRHSFFPYPFLINFFLIYYYMDLEVPLCGCGYSNYWTGFMPHVDVLSLGREKCNNSTSKLYLTG